MEFEFSIRVSKNGILAIVGSSDEINEEILDKARKILKFYREEHGFKDAGIWVEGISYRYSDGTPVHKAGTLKRIE